MPCSAPDWACTPRAGSPTWCTPTTGWSPIRRSRWPNSTTCQWFPPSTPPRRGGTRAGCRAGSADRCTPSSRGSSGDSDALIACSASMADEISELFGPGLAEITVIRNGIDVAAVGRSPVARRHDGPPRTAVLRTAGVREGRPRRHRGAAPDPAHPSRDDADCRGRWHPAEVAGRGRPEAQGAQGDSTSSAVSTTTSCCGCCTAPMPRCCPATTSRSASSPSRPPPPASPWSPPTSGGWARR